MFYTRKETIEKLNVTPPALYLFIERGLLTKYKQGNGAVFFDKNQVDELVEKRKTIKAVN